MFVGSTIDYHIIVHSDDNSVKVETLLINRTRMSELIGVSNRGEKVVRVY